MNDTQNEADIFLTALNIDSPDSRSAYLDAACDDNDRLRQRVESLLRQHLESKGMLDMPPPGLVAMTGLPAIAEQAGSVIGPYKLLEQIGEGGFGMVFMAEQTQPMQRKVALKIIKPGMDTRQVIARFEAERQALALMDHPNIARVLTPAPPTPAGRTSSWNWSAAYRSPTIATQHQLSIRERLELFVTVCQAVQHAHQKGIIHRDVKPTNVLVAHARRPAWPKSSTSASPRRPAKSSPTRRYLPALHNWSARRST